MVPFGDGERPPGGWSVAVRGVHLGDLIGLRHQTILRLDQPEAQLTPSSPLAEALTASLPWGTWRPRIFVAHAGRRLVGCAHFRPVAPDQRWLLVALGAATGVYEAGPVWEALLHHAVVDAGLNGVKRLYARVPAGAPAARALRAVGFAPYASETLFVATAVVPRRPGAGLRRQASADTWAIHQLYNASVPRQVQYAEALTSHHWDVDRDDHAVGYLIEEGHHVVGYARLLSRGATRAVELFYHPERRDILDDLIDGVLARLAARPVDRVYWSVRGYQAEVATAIQARGFAPILEQDLHIKYTTASVRLSAFEAVPFHVDVREKLPKRVPTFLHGQPGDESAT